MELTFLEHLEEFRRRLWVAFAVFFATVGLCFLFSDRLLEFFLSPLVDAVGDAYFFSPQGAFVLKVKAALLAGLVLSLPVWLWELWLFLAPALYPRESKFILPVVFLASAFFIVGVLFAFFIVMPPALGFLLKSGQGVVTPLISAEAYFGFLCGLLLAFGVAFNLPFFVLALVFLGLADTAVLNRYQRHAIVGIFVAAAVLTPGPDVASQLLLAAPLLFLYEVSVVLSVLVGKKRKGVRARS